MSYEIKGRILEVCSCNVLCPCWVGQDADGGECQAIAAWRVDEGTIDGVDVSGHTLALAARYGPNVLDGNWRVVMYVDEEASQEQREALVSVFSGKLGGPVADLAQLFGEILGVESVPLDFEIADGKGTLRVGRVAAAELAPFEGATGRATTLHDTVFSSIPGSPAYVGAASKYRLKCEPLDIDLDLEGHNAIQGEFAFAS
jgi:hypothetical protein